MIDEDDNLTPAPEPLSGYAAELLEQAVSELELEYEMEPANGAESAAVNAAAADDDHMEVPVVPQHLDTQSVAPSDDLSVAPHAEAASDPTDLPDAAITATPSAEATTDVTDAPAADSSTAAPHPGDTAEIDVEEVEARLKEDQEKADLGSTMSFAPLTDEDIRINTDSTYDAGTTKQLMWGARSDVGCVRGHNEDSYLVQSPLFCVCDGMGGHAAGEVASSIAVETIAKTAPDTADPTRLAAAVEAANAAVIEAAVNGLGKPGMGCTATCAYIEDTTIAIAHVGDSRAYLLHEGTLIRVTRDHSYVEELVDAGEITADEARVHPNRSVITRALGSDPAMYADHFQLTIEEGDRLILCSDGLSSMVPDREIETIATQSSTAQICVDNLVDAALAAGGSDNVTVIAVDVVDDGRYREISRKRKRNAMAALCGAAIAIVLAVITGLIIINNNVYLGVKDGTVAIYTGVHRTVMGIKLYHLEDETSVQLSDLPDDTQKRLKQGIPQGSVDEAMSTISKYRAQIDQEQTQQVQDAETIRNSTGETTTDEGSTDAAQTTTDSTSAEGSVANE